MTVDTSQLVAEADIVGDEPEDTRLLRKMAEEVRAYVGELGYWDEVAAVRLGFGVGGVVAVFLVDAQPNDRRADGRLWVVVGDVPPLYLVTDHLETPLEALSEYISLRQEWVDAVLAGDSLDGLAPVDAPPSVAAACALATRLTLLGEILADARRTTE